MFVSWEILVPQWSTNKLSFRLFALTYDHTKLESLTFFPSALFLRLSNEKFVCNSFNPIHCKIQVYLWIPGVTYPQFTSLSFNSAYKVFLTLDEELFSAALVERRLCRTSVCIPSADIAEKHPFIYQSSFEHIIEFECWRFSFWMKQCSRVGHYNVHCAPPEQRNVLLTGCFLAKVLGI